VRGIGAVKRVSYGIRASQDSNAPLYRVNPRAVVIQAEQRDDSGDIGLAANVVADPSGLRQDMMRFSLTCRDELLADVHRKRQICHSIAMEMSKLTSPESKLDATKSVLSDRHTRPR
jgi:hypothetical protein